MHSRTSATPSTLFAAFWIDLQISLLKLVLFRWCPYAVSMSLAIHSDSGRRYYYFWCPKRVIWQACCVHFGTLGDHRAILERLGAPEGRPWVPGLDFCRFFMEFETAFWKPSATFWAIFVILLTLVPSSLFLIMISGFGFKFEGTKSSSWCQKCCNKQVFT